MAFEEGTKVLVCPTCKAQYQARWSRMVVREWQHLPCKACGGVLVSGNSTIDYFDVQLIKPD